MRMPPALIAVTPGTCTTRAARALLERVCELALVARVGLLLREPNLSSREQLELLRALRARVCDAWIAAHARPELALAAGCDAVHLSFRSLAPRELRAWLGARLCIGLSAHAHDSAERWSGADYLFLGPVHATASKRELVEPLGWTAFASEVRRAAGVPVFAIGGLGARDVAAARAAGARGLALRGAIFDAAQPAHAALACAQAWREHGGDGAEARATSETRDTCESCESDAVDAATPTAPLAATAETNAMDATATLSAANATDERAATDGRGDRARAEPRRR